MDKLRVYSHFFTSACHVEKQREIQLDFAGMRVQEAAILARARANEHRHNFEELKAHLSE